MTDSVQDSADQGRPPTPSVTPAYEFRRVREEGEIITIPSTGRRVRIRTVKPAALLRLGKIPDVLATFVMRSLYGQVTNEEYERFFSMPERMEHAMELAESLRVICTAALIEPRIVEAPQAEDEIHIDDLEDREQRYLFDLALMEASDLRRFREQQEADLADMAKSPGAELSAEPAAGD